MTEQNIRIFLRSERYEVEESLFSTGEEDVPTVMPQGEVPAPEVFEIRTQGRMTTDGERVELLYDETEATGMMGSRTSVSFMKNEPSVVTMTREGGVSTNLVFESGKRYRCVYQTPYMPFEICVRTLKVENAILGVGTLTLDYVIEIRGAKAERNKLFLQVL